MKPHTHVWTERPTKGARGVTAFDCPCGAAKEETRETDGFVTTRISYPETVSDRLADEFRQLHSDLVPRRGQASTVQGELVRAIARLSDEYFKEGNANWDVHFRSFVKFLKKHLLDETVFGRRALAGIEKDLETIGTFGGASADDELDEDAFARITERVVWVRKHPEPIAKPRDAKLRR